MGRRARLNPYHFLRTFERLTGVTPRESGETNEDDVLISRLLNSAISEFVIAAAGITQYGEHTVGEESSK